MHAKYSENYSGNRIKSFFSLRCSVSLFYFIRPVLAIRDNSRYSLFRPAEPVTKRPDILRCCVLGFCCRFRESHLQIHFAVSVRRSPGQLTQLYTAPAVRANRWSVTSCTLHQTVSRAPLQPRKTDISSLQLLSAVPQALPRWKCSHSIP